MGALGSYTTHLTALQNLDKRTKEYRILKSMRQELAKLLDHQPNAAELALIERLAWVQLRCAVLDQRMIDGTFTSFDGDVFNAHANTLARGFEKLGLLPGNRTKPATSDDYPAVLRAYLTGK